MNLMNDSKMQGEDLSNTFPKDQVLRSREL